MKTAQIRQAFLDFFASKNHEVVASSGLVPHNDPTLLFTNAGMVQFKDVFLGHEKRPYSRATSSQKCVRAGGKHNDLENVGFTARHHTFFEMLGNFSFGDYFKREAIQHAWEFVTQVLKIPAEKLWITVHLEDDESADIWLEEIGIDPQRLSRCDEDNFWSMGDTGPCGPCTEIFYDHGPSVAGGPPGSPEEDGDRYCEIWNLVFMQYNRDQAGNLSPLPKQSVDTGMGLERVAAVMQGVHSNFEIDLFQNLINKTAKTLKIIDTNSRSLRVIADHLRAATFLLAEQVLPSNEGRGYVLRRILRRAIRHGVLLEVEIPFMHKLIPHLVVEMGESFPEIKQHQQRIIDDCLHEETQFVKTLDQGLKRLEQEITDIKGTVIPGELIFQLYDTYGFPPDLTKDIAVEKGMELDMDGFEQAMLAQRDRARKQNHFQVAEQINTESISIFTGYDTEQDSGKVVEIFNAQQQASTELTAGTEGALVLTQTPFYAESGGQVGDTGVIKANNNVFEVRDTQRVGDAIIHHGVVSKGKFEKSQAVNTEVNSIRRQAIRLNHSATHLMHAALKMVLGNHVQQKGSIVDEKRLRFDFSHNKPLTVAELQQIEQIVNKQIRSNSAIQTELMDKDEAVQKGAVALFGEKYDQKVRVLSMGDGYSVELCGGTHATRTGDIALFKITTESGVAAGVRRIEAMTGEAAFTHLQQLETKIQNISEQLKSNPEQVLDKVAQLQQQTKQLEKALKNAQLALTNQGSQDINSQVKTIGTVKVMSIQLPMGDNKVLREAVDNYKNQLKSAAIVLAVVDGDKVRLAAGVTKDCIEKLHAGELLSYVAKQLDGKAGGRPDFAQGGGINSQSLPEVLNSVYDWTAEKLADK